MSRFAKQFVLAAIATIATMPTLLATSAQAQVIRCQCTQYVANHFNLSRNFPNAGDWDNGYLQRNNFVRVATAQPGTIAVMERTFSGADRTFGHVGIVESNRNGFISLRGANQPVGGNLFAQSGCNNVRITNFGTNVNGNPHISFWKRG